MTKQYYTKDDPVSIYPLREYSVESARVALERVLAPLGGLDYIERGSRVIIKANLVSAMKPEAAGTTHPVLLSALCDMLSELVWTADSAIETVYFNSYRAKTM